MPIQLTDEGLETQTQNEIREEIAESLRDQLGPNIHLDPVESQLGQVLAVVTETQALTQQAVGALYTSIDPNGASKRPLDARVALTGTVRNGKTSSYVDGLLTFTGSATVPNGSLYKHDDTDTIWEVTDGPHTIVGAGTLAAQLTAVAEGPTDAAALSTWSNVTVIANVTGFTNPDEGATRGRLEELDPSVRRRQAKELQSQGQGPLGSIEGAVSKVDGVIEVQVYHNPSTYPADADGIPFKAFNVVVETSPATPTVETQQLIHDAIWSATGGGGEAYGTDYVGTITDTEGQSQPSAFDTVDILDVAIEIDLETSTSESATTPNLTAVVAASVLELAQSEHAESGRDVLALDYCGVIAELQRVGTIAGVDGITIRLGFDPPGTPTAVTKLAVGIRERASFDAARITVIET